MLISEPIPVESQAETAREKPEGKHTINTYPVCRGKDFLAIHIKGSGFLNLGFLDPHFFVVFPVNREHSKRISNATDSLIGGGPSEANPDAAGTISIEESIRTLKVAYAQSHYKVDERGISRSFASKMSPWRTFAFKQLLELAREKRKNIQFSRNELSQGAVRDLIKVAKAQGYQIEEARLRSNALKIKVR